MSARGSESPSTMGGGDSSICQRLREDVAVAVLTRGPLPPDIETHAAVCAPCHDEFAALAGLRPLLRAVEDRPPEVVEPSDLLLPRLLAEVTRRRARRRWVSLAAAAAVVAVAVPLGMALGREKGGTIAEPPRTPTPSSSSVVSSTAVAAVFSSGEATDPITGAEVEVEVRSTAGWGSAITVAVKDVPPGTQCRLLVVDTAGTKIEAGSWTVPEQVTDDYQAFPASVKTPPKRVASVELVDDATNRTMVKVSLIKA